MQGRVSSGQLCIVSPDIDYLRKGDIVLCKVNGRQYLHLIKAESNGRYLIGNNKGRINGWVGLNGIYGKLIHVED